jgi:hypothetical protein
VLTLTGFVALMVGTGVFILVEFMVIINYVMILLNFFDLFYLIIYSNLLFKFVFIAVIVEFIYFYWVLCGRVEGWLSGG